MPSRCKSRSRRRRLTGHTGEIRVLAFGPGGLISGGDDKLIITWNMATGKETAIFKDHTGRHPRTGFDAGRQDHRVVRRGSESS